MYLWTARVGAENCQKATLRINDTEHVFVAAEGREPTP